MQNDMQWPQIEAFVHHFHGVIISNYLNHSVHTAACIIQHSFRQHKKKETCTTVWTKRLYRLSRHAFTRRKLIAFFEESLAIAHIKLDGTNVGIDNSGDLFGRRLRINDTSDSYQSTNISFLRSSSGALSISQYLASRKDPELTKLQFRVYGELVCNNRHGYEKEGLYKSWRCFGAIADASKLSPVVRESVCREMIKGGFALKDNLVESEEEGGAPRIVLYANDALRKAIEFGVSKAGAEKGVKAAGGAASVDSKWFVSELSRGSLADVVSKSFQWMLKIQGEGLVITHIWPPLSKSSAEHSSGGGVSASNDDGGGRSDGDDDCGGGGGGSSSSEQGVQGGFAMAHKWKCACEPQGKNRTLLVELEQRIACLEEVGLAFLLPASVKAMIVSLSRVANAEVPAAQKNQTVKQKSKVSGQGACEDAGLSEDTRKLIEDAIASAASKFDSLEAYFSKDLKAGITELISTEVLADLSSTDGRSDDGIDTNKQIMKHDVRALVNRHVGVAFGKWVKDKKAKK